MIDMIWYDMIDKIWYDWYDMIDMIWYMIWSISLTLASKTDSILKLSRANLS